MSKKDEALKLALEALEEINTLSIGENAICLPAEIDTAMDAIREALAEQPAQQEPVDLEAVYETIIRWDIGGGKRSRRELARRIVDLYTSPPAQQEPVERGGLRFYTNGAERQYWKVDGSIDFKDKQGNVTMTIAAGSITSPQPSKPLTDAQKDAARYQYLKTMANAMSVRIDGNHVWRMNLVGIFGPSLDEAIDRAIEAVDGVIVHDDIPHPDMAFDDEENPQ